MTLNISEWVAKWRKKRRRHNARRNKFLAACLTVGLATAWGSSGKAVTINLSVNPTETLSEAYALYYIVNSCGFWFATAVALGIVPAGMTSNFTHDFPNRTLDIPDTGPYHGTVPGYAIVGLHGSSGGAGVTIGFPDDQPVLQGATWETLVQGNLYNYTESYFVDGLSGNLASPAVNFALSLAHSNMRDQIELPFGTVATLISFTDATFAGTARASVPEPTGCVLLVTGMGIFGFCARSGRRTHRIEFRPADLADHE